MQSWTHSSCHSVRILELYCILALPSRLLSHTSRRPCQTFMGSHKDASIWGTTQLCGFVFGCSVKSAPFTVRVDLLPFEGLFKTRGSCHLLRGFSFFPTRLETYLGYCASLCNNVGQSCSLMFFSAFFNWFTQCLGSSGGSQWVWFHSPALIFPFVICFFCTI